MRDVLPDGRTVVNAPLARTVQQTASAGIVGSAGAGVALAAGLALPVISLPALVAVGLADIGAMHARNRRQSHPLAVASRLEFRLADVSDQRRKWAEYLLAIYSHRHHWTLTGLAYPEQLAAGVRATAYPRPWGEGRAGLPSVKSTPAPKRHRGRRSGGLMRWVKELLDD